MTTELSGKIWLALLIYSNNFLHFTLKEFSDSFIGFEVFLYLVDSMESFLDLLIALLTWSHQDSLQSNWTPSTLMEDFDFRLIPFRVMVMGAWSFQWKRQSSVLLSLIFIPESFSHFEICLSFSSNSMIKVLRSEWEAKGNLSSANIVIA